MNLHFLIFTFSYIHIFDILDINIISSPKISSYVSSEFENVSLTNNVNQISHNENSSKRKKLYISIRFYQRLQISKIP